MRQRWSDLAARNVVITGGSRGLGLALAYAFVEQGARVMLLARDEQALGAARDQVRQRTGSEVEIALCDLRDATQIERVMAQLLERWGCVDILVNNAGIIRPGSAEHKAIGAYEEAMAVHFWAPLHTMRAVIPAMRKQGAGRIVNVSSIEGKVALPQIAPYCASKFALTGLSNALRAELARDGVYITTVAPGLMYGHGAQASVLAGPGMFRWQAFATALPWFATRYERAARRIVRACMKGSRWVELDLASWLLIRADAIAPNTIGALMEHANGLLHAKVPSG